MKSLKDLQARIVVGASLRVVDHHKPEWIGQLRVIVKAQKTKYLYTYPGREHLGGALWGDLPKKRSEVEFLDADTFRVDGGTTSDGKVKKFWVLRFEGESTS